jgi:hypothetical protein
MPQLVFQQVLQVTGASSSLRLAGLIQHPNFKHKEAEALRRESTGTRTQFSHPRASFLLLIGLCYTL